MNKIKQLRKQAGWKIYQLAQMAGISATTLSKAEKGFCVRAEIEYKIARALGISILELRATEERINYE